MINNIKSKLAGDNSDVIINVIGSFGVKGASIILSMITMPVYIRYFQDQVVLGVWYTLVSVLNWIMVFDLGLGNGLRNILPEAILNNNQKKIRESISTTYITMSLISFIMGIVGVAIIPLVNWNVFLNVNSELVSRKILSECVIIIYIGVLLQFVLKLISSILFALQKSALVNVLGLSSSSLILITLLVLPSSSLETNLFRMSIVNTVAACVPLVFATIVVFKKYLKGAFPTLKFYNRKYLPQILKIGFALLWLQLAFMILSSTNEFLITSFSGPKYVVEYQAYYKVFKTAAMVFSVALTPIWSAVTKAQARKDYLWIVKVYKLFLGLTIICLIGELCIVPFLQLFIDLWLGEGIIVTNRTYALIFVLSSVLFVLHNVNTSIGNGISCFSLQMKLMTIAAILNIPLAYLLTNITGSWIGVVIAQCIALIPYEFFAPIFTMKKLRQHLAITKSNC